MNFFFQESEEEADYVELINVLEEKVGYSLILCLPDTRIVCFIYVFYSVTHSSAIRRSILGTLNVIAAKMSTFGIDLVTLTLALLHHCSPPKKEHLIVGCLLEGSQNIFFLFQKYVGLRDVKRNNNNNNNNNDDDDDAPPPLPPKSPKSPKPKEETLPPPIPARNYQVRSGESASRISLALQ